MPEVREFGGVCRNGHTIRLQIPMSATEAGRKATPIRCRCGAITECFRSEEEGFSQVDRTRSALEPDPLVNSEPDFRFEEWDR